MRLKFGDLYIINNHYQDYDDEHYGFDDELLIDFANYWIKVYLSALRILRFVVLVMRDNLLFKIVHYLIK